METKQSEPVPTPETDAILAEITALKEPIKVAPLSDIERHTIKRDIKGLAIIALVLLLGAGVAWVKNKDGGGNSLFRQERNW